MKARRVWIVTWDVVADAKDGVEPGQLLSFLDARLGSDTVKAIMKALWISHRPLGLDEKLAFATKPKQLSSTFVLDRDGAIYVGARPRLVARLGSGVNVVEESGEVCVSWIDDITGQNITRRSCAVV